MESALLTELLDFGALGLFSGFLVWLNIKTQKRLDALADSFQEAVEKQEQAHSLAEESIRNRYDAIIERHEVQRQSIYESVSKKIDEQEMALKVIMKHLDDLRQ